MVSTREYSTYPDAGARRDVQLEKEVRQISALVSQHNFRRSTRAVFASDTWIKLILDHIIYVIA